MDSRGGRVSRDSESNEADAQAATDVQPDEQRPRGYKGKRRRKD